MAPEQMRKSFERSVHRLAWGFCGVDYLSMGRGFYPLNFPLDPKGRAARLSFHLIQGKSERGVRLKNCQRSNNINNKNKGMISTMVIIYLVFQSRGSTQIIFSTSRKYPSSMKTLQSHHPFFLCCWIDCRLTSWNWSCHGESP